MRRHLSKTLSLIFLDGVERVQVADVDVRVHRYQDVGHVCLGGEGEMF